MPHFDGKHNPLNQLTPLLDPSPNEDSHNALTINLWSLTPEKSPLQLLYTENTSAPSYIFARTDFPPKQLGHPSQAPYSGYYESCLLIG